MAKHVPALRRAFLTCRLDTLFHRWPVDKQRFYNTSAWQQLRAEILERDRHRCTVANLLGGDCTALRHVHHIQPRSIRPDLELDPSNLMTVCSTHHPKLEAVRRLLEDKRKPARCPHKHLTLDGRLQCEARLAGRRSLRA